MDELKISHMLVAGAVAGLSVDVSLFPIDTIKTRLQSADGFAKSGGFRGIYSGLLSTAVGSIPTAVGFFCTYELIKSLAGDSPASHAVAGSCGEFAAVTMRVPVEVVKQRAQATRTSSSSNFWATVKYEGPKGFYRGFWSTVFRDVPFSFIQLPLWEAMKKMISDTPTPAQSALCGALSGGVAAALTNPLDVAKTRIILAKKDTALAEGRIVDSLRHVYKERGWVGLTAGIAPRVLWMSVGGCIFLGSYDLVKSLLSGSPSEQ